MSQLPSDHEHHHVPTNAPLVPRRHARDVIVGWQAELLSDIALPGVAATIWQRKPDTSFQGWINCLTAEQLPELRVAVPLGQAEEAVRAACKKAKMPPGPEQNWFINDIGSLARVFCDILKVDHIQIRLDIATGKLCPSFHRDNVPARLLCTYRGPGTEYVPEHHLDDLNRIRTMNTGAVGVFRGSRWMSAERCSLLHRSPGVQPGSGARLLLVIDCGTHA